MSRLNIKPALAESWKSVLLDALTADKTIKCLICTIPSTMVLKIISVKEPNLKRKKCNKEDPRSPSVKIFASRHFITENAK